MEVDRHFQEAASLLPIIEAGLTLGAHRALRPLTAALARLSYLRLTADHGVLAEEGLGLGGGDVVVVFFLVDGYGLAGRMQGIYVAADDGLRKTGSHLVAGELFVGVGGGAAHDAGGRFGALAARGGHQAAT